MIGQEPFNGVEKRLIGFGLLVLVFAYFYNLGIYPLSRKSRGEGSLLWK